ncbi:DMT family transporter [Neptuniibacter halophilus]|uniref:DMT family transporter n=1 Tax=Neptuniibacter halophilus TaxID=651666 RepID=UPI00257238AC|nr:DMT family transporter [Neptuniibacter halophilus]
MNNSLTYALFMLLAGIGIPTMATLNGGLGSKLLSSTLATTISLAVGFTVAVIYLFATEGVPSKLVAADTPVYYYLGGFCVAFYIISVTWIAPRFGISNAIAFALLGQLIAMSAIDHFGLLGAQQSTIGLQRIIGLGLMAAGVFLVLNKTTPATV